MATKYKLTDKEVDILLVGIELLATNTEKVIKEFEQEKKEYAKKEDATLLIGHVQEIIDSYEEHKETLARIAKKLKREM